MTCFYEPSGEYEWAGLPGLPVGLALGSFSGQTFFILLFYNLAGYEPYTRHFFALALFALVIFVFFAAGLMVRRFKMRNPKLAAKLAATGGAAGCLLSGLFMGYLTKPDGSFPEYVIAVLTGGDRGLFQIAWPSTGLPQIFEIFPVLMFFLLIIFVFTALPAFGAARQAAAPYSELAGQWLGKRKLGLVAALPEPYEDIIEKVEAGNLEDLKVLEAKKKDINLSRLKFDPFLAISVMGAEAVDEVYVTVDLFSKKATKTVAKNIELTDEEMVWILDKFDRYAD